MRLKAFMPTRIERAVTLSLAIVIAAAGPALGLPEPGDFAQVAQLTAHDGAAGDQFGYSVALDGPVAVAGANLNDASATDAGAAYVFDATEDAWTAQATLRPAGLGPDDRFGQAVAASGDRIVVGAPRDDDLDIDTGAAYVFVRTETGWELETKLLPVGGIAYGRAGAAVAIDGDTIAFAGGRRVFVYSLTESGWVQQATLLSPTGTYDYFGCSIAISGDSLLVGAHGFQSAYDQGRAYVFSRTDGVWSLQATLQAADGASGDMFGCSVDIDADSALVGAWGDDDAGTTCGAAYAFGRTETAWSQTAKLVPAEAGAYDEIGYFVSLDGPLAAVSAHYDDEGGSDAGAVYLFDSSAGWAQTAKLLADDSAAGDIMGNPAVSDQRVFVGAIGSDVLATDAGAAYAFAQGAGDTFPGKGSPHKQGALTGVAR